MEGPSIVIAKEELLALPFKKILKVTDHTKLGLKMLQGQSIKSVKSWGKHLIIEFNTHTYRIHFLMFGSYRIDEPREGRIPKLKLSVKNHDVYFYSCSIKEIDPSLEGYDWPADVLGKDWDPKRAVQKLKDHPNAYLCDILLDQAIFSGVGNIIKNEVLFRQRLHPLQKVQDLAASQLKKLVNESRKYGLDFYRWKKENVLRKNWQIFKKKICPMCGGKVRLTHAGKLKRRTFYCPKDQKRF